MQKNNLIEETDEGENLSLTDLVEDLENKYSGINPLNAGDDDFYLGDDAFLFDS